MKKKYINQGLKSINYSDAGVNIDVGEELISEISPIAKATSIKGTIGELGGFGGLFDLKQAGFKDPILVSSTDGVGTKLQLAIKTKSYFNIGIDLVAMCANDVLAQGAIPLFFMDYFATGKLRKDIAVEVIKGIAEGCKQSGCALIGGETAEMPGHYQNDSFDVAGFCLGAVERKNLLNKSSVKYGDQVIAVASSGIHSNGYSLVRKIIETRSIDIFKKLPFDNTKPLVELLMEPTLLYTNAFLAANKKLKVKSLSHITGGGLIENPPRAFNKNLTLQFNMSNFHLPPLFKWIQEQANITLFELTRTFNCGIGLLIFADQKDVETILKDVNSCGYKAFLIGSMIEKKSNNNVIFDSWEL
jgi:phosphoribosylformylglycinamidine cyclo-ligase